MPATYMKKSEATKKAPSKENGLVQFRNILFATDFSAAANLAMPFAGGLAQFFGAKLYALHVQEPVNYALPPEMWHTSELTREMEIQALVESIRREYPNIVPEIVQGEGLVREAVETAVEKHNIDLVVIGTRGRTGVGKFLLGSQAEAILRHATCPVVTIGPNVISQARQRGQLKSIVLATNFGPDSRAAAAYAISLAEESAANLTLLHVIEKREANETRMPGESVETAAQRLEALLPADADLWCKPTVVVEHGEPAEKILQLAGSKDADLIVLGVHAPEGVPGGATHLSHATVHKVVAHAECPVLTVPARSAL
jgi:nucleotide-binding universal stress UspA family protein